MLLQDLAEKPIAGENPKANGAMSASIYIKFRVEFRKVSLFIYQTILYQSIKNLLLAGMAEWISLIFEGQEAQ